jgi:vacuolar protein sorting-associated protein 35
MYEALLGFTLAVYPSKLSFIEEALASALALLEAAPPKLAATNPKASKVLMNIVRRPLEHCKEVLSVLQLVSWPPLLAHLSHAKQKEVAALLVSVVISQGVTVSAPADAGKLLAFVQPLMSEDPNEEVDADASRPEAIDEETAAELGPVSRLVHAFRSPSTDDQCRILNAAHRQASQANHRRSPFALVPVLFACLPLVGSIKMRVDAGEVVEVGVRKLLSFILTIIEALTPLAPSLAFRLSLLACSTADRVGEAEDAYEAMTQAFTCYEEEISDSKAQLAAVSLASATLHHTSSFGTEAYDTLATKATQHSARLLKKPDQCRAVTKASLLFAPCSAMVKKRKSGGAKSEGEEGEEGGEESPESPEAEETTRESRMVLECLQRALKIADSCKVSSMHTPLFVEILEVYIYHYHKACDAVLPSYLSSLLQLIEQQIGEEPSPARTHFLNTKAYVEAKKKTEPRFAEIEVNV